MSEQTTEQKIVVVTGASSGIGRGAAIEIAARGMGVVITYNSRPEGAEETVEEIRRNGGSACRWTSVAARPSAVSPMRSPACCGASGTRIVSTAWSTMPASEVAWRSRT
jgi:NAD(P)-dependent dehydrogenase (short-subunit alcohol dehydrogenase family)